MMFSRRFVQHMLTGCQRSFSNEHHAAFLDRLNRCDLSAEWELITLYRLRAFGEAQYEYAFEGASPDIFLNLKIGGALICDVTTVSDEDYRGRGLIATFDKEARRRIREFGLHDKDFSFQIEYSDKGAAQGKRITIDLPTGNLESAFPVSFYDFLRDVRRDPSTRRQAWVTDIQVRYSISFHPNSSYSGQSWTPFAGRLHSRRNNPVANALEAKRKQLRALSREIPKGIVLCDGGCDAIAMRHFDPTGRTYDVAELIRGFLRNTRSVSFVILQFTPVGAFQPSKQLCVELYLNENPTAPLSSEMKDILVSIPEDMPRMTFAPYQARSLARQNALGPETAWQTDMRLEVDESGVEEIKLSARLLRDFLCGKINEDTFRRKALGGSEWSSYFDKRAIVAARVERNTEFHDDDHIVLRMEIDPATSAFE